MSTAEALDFPMAILAGGLATRLGSLTREVPKALVQVAGAPFLAHQLALLRRQGVKRAVVCVGHLGEMIEDFFGDGTDFGVSLKYSFDGPRLLGTGGALQKALPLLGENFFVLYGDSYLPINFAPVATAFKKAAKAGLLTVFRNEGHWDTSNIRFERGTILEYSKALQTPEMHHIDYGLSAFSARAFADLPDVFDLSTLVSRLLAREELAGYEVYARFYEGGSPAGLAELKNYLERVEA
jgi:N-acetyl-alpha-D-muramate 1-phosphate uridylyltransferase